MSSLVAELAVRRLDASMQSGMILSHDWKLKPCKGKTWREKHWDFKAKLFVDDGPSRFKYCEECQNWAWALGGICATKYAQALQKQLDDLREME